MKETVLDLIKNGDIRIPRVLLYNYKKLNIKELDLIVMIYLMNTDDLEFNPNLISKNLGITQKEVMSSIDNLLEKNLIEISSKKIDGVRKDIIVLDNIYDKLLYLSMGEDNEATSDIYSVFEKEFGRTLAPMEYEIINTWLDKIDEELIIAALKEAVFNGVFKLNYIDKILYEWNKKGIKKKEDIKKNVVAKPEKKELYDYNWLEDE